MKEVKAKAKKHKDLMLIMIPLVIATIVVVFNLMPAELLGFFSDAYTIALLFTLVIITVLATRKRVKK
jgi:hypothetical protein